MNKPGSLRVYGLKNCDSCRAARRWLDQHGIDYRFIDLREQPPLPGQARAWLTVVGAQRLINRRSKTWQRLPQKHDTLSDQHLAALIADHPEIVKRPLVVNGPRMMVGFDPERLEALAQAGPDEDNW